MRINENLINLKAPLDTFNGKEFISRDVVGDSALMAFTNQNTFTDPIPELKKGETYTFSAYIRKIQGKSDLITISAGDRTELFDLGYTYKRISITFTYDNFIKGPYIAIYIGKASETAGNKIAVKFPKIEEGEIATTYLPHKSSVKAENQAIFPIGGGTEKCILYNSKGGWVL